MALANTRSQREYDKFVANAAGDTAIRVVVEGSVSQPTAVTHTGTTKTVTHNLGYHPIVQVIDTATGKVTEVDIDHASTNAFTVTAIESVAMKIIYGGSAGEQRRPSWRGNRGNQDVARLHLVEILRAVQDPGGTGHATGAALRVRVVDGDGPASWVAGCRGGPEPIQCLTSVLRRSSLGYKGQEDSSWSQISGQLLREGDVEVVDDASVGRTAHGRQIDSNDLWRRVLVVDHHVCRCALVTGAVNGRGMIWIPSR